MFSEVKFVTLGVADLDRSIAFYADALGYEEISRTTVDGDAVSEAWRIPAGVTGRFAVLGIPGIDTGMLRVVEWAPAGDHVWATPARFQDLGPRLISVRVRDINAAWDTLGRAGAREKQKPTYWETEQNFAAWTAEATDPDGTSIEIFQVLGEIEQTLGPFRAGCEASEVQTISLHCSDAKRTAALYRGIGFEPLYDRVNEQAWALWSWPKGTGLHNIHLIRPGARPNGRIEISQHVGLPGRSLKTRTAPPARGPQMLSLRVTSLEAAVAALKSLGAKAIGSARYDCPPFGPVSSATLFGADDEVIEVFETVPGS